MLCVIAKLPEDASEKLRLLRDSALPGERAGAPLYGHITIATYLPEDDGSFAEAVRHPADRRTPASAGKGSGADSDGEGTGSRAGSRGKGTDGERTVPRVSG